MKALKIKEVLNILNGKLIIGNEENLIYDIKLDSREIESNDAFFCLKGENSDGHLYIDAALKKGASVFVITDESYLNKFEGYDVNVILVQDALISLQDLASYYLSLMPIKKIVAVTGSVGKTSTRDMMKAVLSTKYKTESTIKNYNTPTGIPLSIFGFPLDTEACVIEMGLLFDTTEEALSRFVKPDIAIITNIGISHIERFPKDGRMGILKSKMGVAHFFDSHSYLILNGDNDLLSQVEKSEIYNQIFVGTNLNSEFLIKDVKEHGEKGIEYVLKYDNKEFIVKIPVLGAHNAMNSCLTIAAGLSAGIEIKEAIKALSSFELPDNRLSIRKKGNLKVIDDCYNAAPESMKSALDTLKALDGKGKKIAILGDMLELGTENEKAHRSIGEHLRELEIDIVVLIGKSAKMIFEEYKKGIYFENIDDAIRYIKDNKIISDNDIVLCKASNGMHLNKIVEEILK